MQGEHPIRAQVLVAGGGPVGMLVAAELAAYGVDTVLLEPRTEVSDQPKATTLHARAVQSLARRGHMPGPARPAYGPEPASSAFHFAGLPGLTITAPPHEPEPVLKCAQADLERHLESRARTAGARILRGHRVTDVEQDGSGVRGTAEGPQGSAVLRADYVVGADGARSTVRTRSGIESDTVPATVSALMGTVTLADSGDLPKGWHRTPRGWIVAKHDGDRTHLRTLNCAGPHEDRGAPSPWTNSATRWPTSRAGTSRCTRRTGSAGSATSHAWPARSAGGGSSSSATPLTCTSRSAARA